MVETLGFQANAIPNIKSYYSKYLYGYELQFFGYSPAQKPVHPKPQSKPSTASQTSSSTQKTGSTHSTAPSQTKTQGKEFQKNRFNRIFKIH